MPPIMLAHAQLDLVRTAAYRLPRALRSAFLQKLTAQLEGRDLGDGELHRIAHGLVRDLMAPPPKQPQAGGEVLRGFGVSP